MSQEGFLFQAFVYMSAAVVAVPVAIILGILAALYRNSLFDKTISMVTLSTISFPEFFVAYILIALLSVQMIIFPSISNINDQMSFWQKIHAIVLPCLTLTLVVVAHMMRQTRAAIINILSSPFIEMAKTAWPGMATRWRATCPGSAATCRTICRSAPCSRSAAQRP